MTTAEPERGTNLPAVVETRAMVAAPADTDSWVAVVSEVAKLAQYVADTEFVPRALRGNAAAATAAILYGREIGLAPITSLNAVHMVEGAPSLSAEQMRALVLAAGHDIEFLESTGAVCKVRGRRRGSQTWTPVEWSIDMARAAGLLARKSSPWVTYPRRMLQARASSELCEMVFPDVIHGFRTREVMEDSADETAAGDAAAAPRSTSRVARKSSPKLAAETPPATPPATTPETPGPAVLPDRPPAPARPARRGVPLPGEPGYDRPSSGPHAADIGPAANDAAAAGAPGSAPAGPDTTAGEELAGGGAERVDPPAAPARDPGPEDGPEPRTRAEEDLAPEEPADVVDAEIVGETPPARIDRIRPAQKRMILSKLGALGLKGTEHRDERLRITGYLIGRDVATTNELSKDEAGTMIDTLALCADLAQLRTVAEETHAAEDERRSAEPEPPEDPER